MIKEGVRFVYQTPFTKLFFFVKIILLRLLVVELFGKVCFRDHGLV